MIKRNLHNFNIAALALAGTILGSTMASATVVDLVNGDSGRINGALFQYTAQQPTGTGVIDPFLRVQNTPSEQGYNTSGGTPFDAKAGPWTHNIQFSDLQQTTITLNGAQYFQILLDVNEPNGAKSLVTLDSLQFYTSATGSKTTTNVMSLGTLRYDLDAGSDGQVQIDAGRNHGSGSGDVNIFIPVSNFAGTNANDFIYMFAAFGLSDDVSAGGFEEFALVPEVSSFFPIIGLIVAIGSTEILRRRRKARISA